MSIDVNVQNDLVIVTETTEDIVVNVSNAAGPQGPAGAAGVGVPVGGTTGQVLKKFTNTNYDTYWAADASGLTSVGLSVPTGLTVANSPLTSNGTIAVGLASGYSIPTTASQATWNTAYNDSIVSAGVTGTSTKTLTLNQQDGGTVTASWSDIDTGLTSVGLSMPSAFAVSNSPLTSNGTIAVTGAGTADQYVRGDGQLANFPTNGGGGSSVNYYLNGSVSQGTFGGDTYYEMSKTPIAGAGTNFTRTNAQGNGYIASFITDAGDPALLNIPGGNWNIEFYFQASSNGSNPSFYAELYKVSSSNVFTLIGSGSTNPEGITNGTAVDQYFTSIPVPQTALLATDRIAIRIFVTPSGRTITLHTENSNLCEVLTTFSTGLNALNGLTAQVQYFATGTSGTDFAISSATDTHTFNIPTASGTNRGALSSADWTTFSGKVGGSGATGQVAYWNGTNSQTGSNNLFWDAANARLGIGTNSPSTTLDIRGKTRIESTSNCEFDFINGSNIVRLALSATTGFVGTLTSLPFAFFTAATRRGEFSINGNFLIGTTSDGGQRLQVYGDAFVKGSGATSATNALLVQNSAGTQLLKIQNDGTGNIPYIFYVGQNSTNPFLFSFDGNSSSSPNASSRNLAYYNTNTTQTGDQTHFALVGNALTPTSGDTRLLLIERSFAPTSGTAIFTAQRIIPTINQTGGANGITRGLYVNPTLTAAADWRSIEWSNNSGWGLYGAGTAPNYLGGTLTASSFIKSGGTSSQYLMADGSVTTGSALTITNRQTASYTLALTDADKLVEMNVATANNLTVPLNSSVAFAIGTKIDIAQYGAGQTTFVATSGVTVRSAGGALKIVGQYSAATLVKIATDEWYLIGNITT